MLSALALAATIAAVNPWDVNDPFPLPPTYQSVISEGKASLNLGVRGVFENWEIEGLKAPRPYEQWKFFQEANPFVRYELSKFAELKAGLRIKHDFGGKVTFMPRIAYVDDRPKHTFIFGNYRANWSPGILYQPLSADDHMGALFRYGRKLGVEGFLSRPEAVADDQYERYIAGVRAGLRPGGPVVLQAQGLIEHAAGFDTAELPYRRPTLPTVQMIQTGLYGELNFLGRNTGLHAEYGHTAGKAVWEGKQIKPHGRYRAFGGHAYAFNITARAEYRRVDQTYISPQGPLEYRRRYPLERNVAPDSAVASLRWFYPFHKNGSLLVDVEEVLFVKKSSLNIEGNQNRASLALQVQF